MGRMLDSLKQLNGQSKAGPEAPPPASEPKPAAPVVEETLEAEDMPFIEVGAPGKKIEGSPNVMAAAGPAPKPPVAKPSAAPAKTEPVEKPTLVPPLSEPAALPPVTHALSPSTATAPARPSPSAWDLPP